MAVQKEQIVEHVKNHVVDGHIGEDFECLNCGYNLRTLAVEGDCPECGMGVKVSLRKDLLRDASPAWLMMIVRGLKLLRLGVILAFPMLYIGVVVGTVGFFHLLQKQSGREEPTKDRNLRLAAQGLLSIGAMGFIGVMVSIGWAVFAMERGMFTEVPYFDVLFLGVHAVYLLGVLLAWRNVRVLGERIPDDKLINGCKRVTWEWIGAAGGILGIGLLANIGNVIYTQYGHYNWLYAPVLMGFVCLILLWLWWRTVKFCGIVIESVGEVIRP
ncbi:hypothetical protein [Poriferisphaera corsica]|nr:hypothetical protein [Poriferisphaera corsica]